MGALFLAFSKPALAPPPVQSEVNVPNLCRLWFTRLPLTGASCAARLEAPSVLEQKIDRTEIGECRHGQPNDTRESSLVVERGAKQLADLGKNRRALLQGST